MAHRENALSRKQWGLRPSAALPERAEWREPTSEPEQSDQELDEPTTDDLDEVDVEDSDPGSTT